MAPPIFSDVTPASLSTLEAALAQLSADLGDAHRVDTPTLRAALFGPAPACHGVLAHSGDGSLLGAALYSPVMSTSLGAAGVFVSDLWVAEAARGQALGPALLAHVAGRAGVLWQARFMRLVAYGSNTRARAFYQRLGFAEKPEDILLQLSPDNFDEFNG